MAKRATHRVVQKQHKVALFRGTHAYRSQVYRLPSHHFLVVSSVLRFVSLGEVERMRMYLRRLVGKKGKVWARERTFVPLHKKAKGARMGKGIGAPSGRCVLVREGDCLFELEGLFAELPRLRKDLPLCLRKFSFPCRWVEASAQELF